MLLRRFIAQRLAAYYAQHSEAVVGAVSSAHDTATTTTSSTLDDDAALIPFQSLWGEYHWKRVLDRLYNHNKDGGHWLTPVELFQPYYSNAVANFIAQHVATIQDENEDDEDDRIDILEIGGGRGTNALRVLNHLQATQPQLYDRIHYTLLDASPTLHQHQRRRLSATRHADKVSFVHQNLADIVDPSNSNNNQQHPHLLPPHPTRPTVIMAMEVCDNLPHDKIRSVRNRSTTATTIRQAEPPHANPNRSRHNRQPRSKVAPSSSSATLEQCTIRQAVTGGEPRYEEQFVPLTDPLLRTILRLSPNYIASSGGGGGSGASWIPTIALGMLHQLPQIRPNATVILADFDWFPSSLPTTEQQQQSRRSLRADEGEPLIKAMDENRDYDCYLEAPILSDILFPTQFHHMRDFVRRSWKQQQQQQQQSREPNPATMTLLDHTVSVDKQANFLMRHGPDEVAQTTSWLTGYSPMIHDYSNTSVLTITTKRL